MKAVIIGAGQTGRGFVAPILYDDEWKITFVDKNAELIDKLNREKQYNVKYFQQAKPTKIIDRYKAYHVDDEKVIDEIANADIVTTSVFANQIETLIPLLKKGIDNRDKDELLTIICIENGINVKKPLIDAKLEAYISEGVIFCTSVRDEVGLGITSEANITELPIDKKPLNREFDITNMPEVNNFSDIIQRKIYTYNFMSAVISYLGSYKNYEMLGDAANDEDIVNIINKISISLNKTMADKFNVTLQDQEAFTQQAVDKFSNREIEDTVVRNAQQAKRKLGFNERMMVPLKMAIKHNEEIKYYCIVIASAIHYGVTYEDLIAEDIIKELSKDLNEEAINCISNYYTKFKNNEELSIILEK